jgi:hypothetical protein
MSHAIQSVIVVVGCIGMLGLVIYSVASMLGRDTTTINVWLGRIGAIFLFAFFSYGTFMCYRDAFILSRHGTPAIAHATFKRSYVPRRRVRPVFVYDMIFDEHRIEKEYLYHLESAEVRVVYDPSAPEQFMIGEVNGSALQLLRSDMKADFWFVFVWPVFVIAAAVAIVFSWRRQPPADRWAAEVVD